ncbi:MAG: DEAD/DEAH box helicase [Candidatus Komeilibacteria bacterium]
MNTSNSGPFWRSKPQIIAGADNLFSRIYLTTQYDNGGGVWLLFNNDYEIKRAKELLLWWQHKQADYRPLIVWPDKTNAPAAILQLLVNPFSTLILTSHNNIQQSIPDLISWEKQIIKLITGQNSDPYALRQALVNNGYIINPYADLPGYIAVRGETMDIWSPQCRQPYRLSWDKDKLTNIQIVDWRDKSLGKKINTLEILPITNALPSEKPLLPQLQKQSALLSANATQNYPNIINAPWRELIITQLLPEENAPERFGSAPTANNRYNNLRQQLAKFNNDYITNVITTDPGIIKDLALAKNLSFANIYQFTPFIFSGLVDKKAKIIWLTDQHLLPPPSRKEKQNAVLDLNTLKLGDYIVHRDHGIGQLTAFTYQTIDNQTREYLVLQYAAADKLYLPVEQIDKITKYIGPSQPKVQRLGAASTWAQTVRKLKQDIVIMAQQLLNLYARRDLVPAAPLWPHPAAEAKLAADFPYQETPDQSQAVKDVLSDLARPQPTDRLICGDVGFGKTEVAIRAAWRAVLNKKQVAVLCPTTILAQQHYDTLKERLKNYPVKIGLLSRFVDKNKQAKRRDELASGAINIMIGTHRLLSTDIKWHDLGLIIIDEEQQFGVATKEKLKDVKTSAHVLTLSATPIPRTLNLSLSGLRDISIINTAPMGRQAINTIIKPFSDNIIKEAINKEIARGGQVYYLYNKVQSIAMQKARLQQLLPKLRYGIVHGQLPAAEIARVMHEFDQGNIDVLICSTIIANGLDLPNVNTLIVDGAQNFGLPQLYQIRGRIGRSDREAWAYFLYHSTKLAGAPAARLRALQEASALGSGMQVAMRDMELRGIGNILGKEQHGHVSLVGLTYYHELIKQTVAEIKTGLIPTPLIDPQIDLPLTIGLPQDLKMSPSGRLRLYQLLASAPDEDALNKHLQKIPQPWPEAVYNLRTVLTLKLLASKAKVTQINALPDGPAATDYNITLTLNELTPQQKRIIIDNNPLWRWQNHSLKIKRSQLSSDWLDELAKTLKLLAKEKPVA